MAADGLICEGDHLVLDVNGEKLSFVQKLKATGKVRVGKFMVPGAPLIGAPYGALFEVINDGKALQRVLLPPSDEITRITETEKNNSGLFDRNTENQKLTQEQIEDLKKSGKAGAEIIAALCSNSATFQNKTEFSQDKYKKRKAKKYLTYVTVRKPCARIICEAYYDKAPERVSNLRHDSLAMIMSLGNVAAGAKVLVAEQCCGVVTAAAVERLGGVGALCAVQLDERQAPLDAVRQMNLSIAQRSVLFTAPAGSLLRDQEAVANGKLYGNATSTTQQQMQMRENASSQQEAVAAAGGSGAAAAGASMVVDAAPPAEAAAAATADTPSGAPKLEGVAAAAQASGQWTEMEVDAAATAAAAAAAAPAGDAPAAAAAPEEGKAVLGAIAGDDRADEAPAGAAGGNDAAASAGEAAGGEGTEQQRQDQQQQQQRQGAGCGADGGHGGGYGSFLPRPEQLRAVLSTGFDSCVIASPRVHPTALLAALWPLLAPSASFVVFSPWAQPLAEAFAHLQGSRNAVLLQLQESWLRPYQVLPARTHPHMSCSGTGGFILSGIKIIPPDATPLEHQLQLLYAQQQQLQVLPLVGGERPSSPGRQQQQGEGAAAGGQGDGDGKEELEQEEEGGDKSPSGGRGGGRGRGGRGWEKNGGGNNGWGRGGGGGRWGRGSGGRDDGGRFGGKRKAEGGRGDSPGGKRQAT